MMSVRVGIELAGAVCRVVEVEGARARHGQPAMTGVRSYAIVPRRGTEVEAALSALRRRFVAVVVWGARSEHRQVVVARRSYERMRAEALRTARAAGVDSSGTLSDVAPLGKAPRGSRQPVLLALARADEISAALQPLVDAGLRIRCVLTPADALLTLARSRAMVAPPGGIEAYVALDETATCVALVRDGALVAARELPWGYRSQEAAPARSGSTAESEGDALDAHLFDPPVATADPRREDVAARLAGALTELLALADAPEALSQVAICGGLPDLRTMTAPLMERLDVEVETLDSLFGIDDGHLPDPANQFRERSAELRIAWAAAADRQRPIDFMRARRRRQARAALARAAVVAGVAAGVGTALGVPRTGWWRSRARTSEVARRSGVPGSLSQPADRREAAGSRPEVPRPVPTSAPPLARPTPAVEATEPVPASRPRLPPGEEGTGQPASPDPGEPVRSVRPSQASGNRTLAPPAAAAAPPVVVPPVAVPRVDVPRVAAAPAVVPPVAAAPAVVPPMAVPPVRTLPPVAERPDRPPAGPPARQESRTARARQAPPTEAPPVPLNAALGTILYSPERRLAIIDGRIVTIGDEVSGARVVDITPGMVLLRDGRGALRSLTLATLDRR